MSLRSRKIKSKSKSVKSRKIKSKSKSLKIKSKSLKSKDLIWNKFGYVYSPTKKTYIRLGTTKSYLMNR